MAKVIEATQKPALVPAPDKTPAPRLFGEFKCFFPDDAVEYFAWYCDYCRPQGRCAADGRLY